ncbi:hypothetical protein HPB47_020796 [Ixodes persulcatus]|uniref:Uncharacterized protein n=1 Tax=Ixodes persulcatus TaxID=34615 RepID=A0AC60QEG3_IXOPE|nr:hypothetical protein HPB47_020796 [Ixodes persulcatus]
MNVKRAFDSVRRAQGKGPLVVTEYYSGWMDHWGSPHTKTDSSEVLKTFEEILRFNASVNFYMFHGGTNFGFSNGRNPPSQPTSYDYGAPLSEAGDPTDLYYKIRNITSRGQEPLDTFLDPTGFGKGVAILNGFNLGRYWPSVGPQVTLYVPGTLLLPYPNVNLVALFEMEAVPEGVKTVKFLKVLNLDGPTPTSIR